MDYCSVADSVVDSHNIKKNRIIGIKIKELAEINKVLELKNKEVAELLSKKWKETRLLMRLLER